MFVLDKQPLVELVGIEPVSRIPHLVETESSVAYVNLVVILGKDSIVDKIVKLQLVASVVVVVVVVVVVDDDDDDVAELFLQFDLGVMEIMVEIAVEIDILVAVVVVAGDAVVGLIEKGLEFVIGEVIEVIEEVRGAARIWDKAGTSRND
jgi:hypothetical protein